MPARGVLSRDRGEGGVASVSISSVLLQQTVCVKIRPRKACSYPNLRSFGWVSYDKVGVLYSGKLGNISEARASDLRSHPGLRWNGIKLRLRRLRK